MLLASVGDKSKSPHGQVVSSLQTMSEKLTWESVTARLLQEFEEKQLAAVGSQSRPFSQLRKRSHALAAETVVLSFEADTNASDNFTRSLSTLLYLR